MVWYSHLFKNFPQFVVIHTVKGLKQKMFFCNSLAFFYDLADAANLICGSAAFSKSGLYIWKFLVHVLLKPELKDFEHYLTST